MEFARVVTNSPRESSLGLTPKAEIWFFVKSNIQFRWRAFDIYSALPGARVDPTIEFFARNGPGSDENISDQSESEIVNWLVEMRQARSLLESAPAPGDPRE